MTVKSYLKGELKQRFQALGYIWAPFHLIGIRSKADLPNKFDDRLYLINEIGNGFVIDTTCTTNPGVHWLKNLLNPKGAAVLKPGQYIDTWKLGKHKGLYEALVQAKPVIVYRDKDKDDKSEKTDVTESGFFGINIHRANANAISTIIDKWSAGCQVINDPKVYAEIIEACKQSGRKTFTYTLLEEW